ncbi:MAG: class I SAM-dependent methyltransferase [Sedimentisphaerales bacterium]|nr:class I SAM-dependent methyltransferase [Sedimentisphaerales bacterium]
MLYDQDDFRHYYWQWKGVEGWLTDAEAYWLFHMAGNQDIKGDIIEIGSAFGRSTTCLAWGARLRNTEKVFAIDPHYGGKGFREQLGEAREKFSSEPGFRRNIKRFDLEEIIIPLVMTSQEARQQWQGSKCRFLFIDGWHTYDAVKHDITAWYDIMLPGGIIACHDYHSDEVRNAIHDSMTELGINPDKLVNPEISTGLVYINIGPASFKTVFNTGSTGKSECRQV